MRSTIKLLHGARRVVVEADADHGNFYHHTLQQQKGIGGYRRSSSRMDDVNDGTSDYGPDHSISQLKCPTTVYRISRRRVTMALS